MASTKLMTRNVNALSLLEIPEMKVGTRETRNIKADASNSLSVKDLLLG